jgi:hypothetical protein
MTRFDKFKKTVKERPKRFALSVFLIVFWIAVPLVSQAYFNYSAVNVSFAITIVYYLTFQVYKRYYK